MGIDEDRFEDVVSKDFICSICLDVVENPLALSDCEHVFCRHCIELWMSKNQCFCTGFHHHCPLDRKTIRFTRMPDEIFNVLYSSLRMHCKNFPYCQEELTIGDFLQHEDVCTNSASKFISRY